MTAPATSKPSPNQCVDAMAAIARQFEAEKVELARGVIECPCCQGKLRYACAKRGHRLVMRGRCDTAGCLEFLT